MEKPLLIKGSKYWFVFRILLILIMFPLSAQAQTLMVDDVAKELVCQCGCQSVLPACTHSECGSAASMKATIKDMIGRGINKEQIILAFVQNYGEKVLAAPPKKGFNLTAWITPFIALIVGGVALFFILKEWSSRSKQSQPAAKTAKMSSDEDPYRSRLEEELRNWKA